MRGPGLGRRVDQLIGASMDAPDELGLQHQVLGRIAGQLQLRAQQQVGALRRARRISSIACGIAVEVADALVHLGERDA